MRTLLLLFAFTLTMASASLLGSQKCSWGPSYWCSGIPQSAKCKATSHCIENYWTKADMPEDDDDVCTICKNMVAEARDTLESNETQTELREVFEGSCQLIPVKPIAKECIKLVDQFIPELVETLASEMNPGVVCATAGLCNSKRIDKLLAHYYSRHPKTACDVCRSEARKLTFLVKEADKDLVLDKALEICGYFSSYSDACRASVLDNFDTIYELLSTKLETVCDMSGLCPEDSNAIALSSSKEDIQCEFCEKVIQHWKDEWTANTTIDEFKEVMEQICKRLDKKRMDHCIHIVDDYYIPAFNYIAHELDPHMLCSLVGLCGENGFLQVGDDVSITMLLPPKPYQVPTEQTHDDANVIRMLPLQPAITITGNEAFHQPQQQSESSNNRLIGGYFVSSAVAYANKPTCEICEYVLHELQNWIGDDRTEEKVQDGLKKICSEMPSSVEAECKHFVDSYGPAIVELFIHDLDPSTVCPMLGLCSSEGTPQLGGEQGDQKPLEELRGDGNCALCEYAMTTLLEVVKDKSNQDEIRNALDGLCGLLPTSLDDKCEKFVDTYAETIIDLISQGITADEICQELGLCKPKISHIKGNQCVICEYVVQTLDGILEDKTDQAKIKQALDELCGYMPKTVTKQCVTFVDTYSQMIIDMLSHDVTPQQLCAEMGLCARSETDAEIVQGAVRIIETNNIELENDRPYCTLCEYAIGEVDKLITDKKNEDEIRKVLDEICYKLSAPIMKECKNIVDQYIDEIVDMFVAEYTPAEVCAKLRLCDPEPVIPHHENAIPPLDEEEHTEVSNVEKSSTLCVLCEFSMRVLEDKLLNNRTFDMVERGVQMLCAYMPQSVAEPCERFVDEYGDKLIHLLVEQELDPEEVCSEIQLCTGADMWDASVYGGHRCNWGPSYWCQSRFHAMACGTTKHCMQTVWN